MHIFYNENKIYKKENFTVMLKRVLTKNWALFSFNRLWINSSAYFESTLDFKINIEVEQTFKSQMWLFVDTFQGKVCPTF